MKHFLIGLTAASLFVILVSSNPAIAASIEMRPTLVADSLGAGEQKKAFVDVINPTGETVAVSFTVEGFRQIDDKGTLEFYDDPLLKKGIQLDLKEVELAGHEAVRMYYMVDSGRLPTGDITGAIFATIKPRVEAPAANAVRVGTLLVIKNGNAERSAAVTRLTANWLQVGNGITTSFAIKNLATDNSRSSFFPSVTIGINPYGSQTVEGPLVSAGRERMIDYQKPGNYFGIVQIRVDVTDTAKSAYIFAVTGYWRWLAPLLLAALGATLIVLKKYRNKSSVSFR